MACMILRGILVLHNASMLHGSRIIQLREVSTWRTLQWTEEMLGRQEKTKHMTSSVSRLQSTVDVCSKIKWNFLSIASIFLPKVLGIPCAFGTCTWLGDAFEARTRPEAS
eukprot:9023139-Pyramimonas_sp.AAC.1